MSRAMYNILASHSLKTPGLNYNTYMAEIFRDPLKFPTDVHLVYDFLSDTLCRRGGIRVVSQIIRTLMTQNRTQLTQDNKLLTLKIHFYL